MTTVSEEIKLIQVLIKSSLRLFVGPLLIGLAEPIEIAPLRTSTSEILNLASVAAYSAEIIDYNKK